MHRPSIKNEILQLGGFLRQLAAGAISTLISGIFGRGITKKKWRGKKRRRRKNGKPGGRKNIS